MQLVERVAVSVSLDPFMSLKALAVYSDLSVRKLRQLIDRDAADALPAYRVDGRVLVRRSEFDDYIAKYRVSGRPGVVEALRSIGLAV